MLGIQEKFVATVRRLRGALVALALIAALLVLLILVGCGGASGTADPFVGTWSNGNPDVRVVVRHTNGGDSVAMVLGGQHNNGWARFRRVGPNELTWRYHPLMMNGKQAAAFYTDTIAYQPASHRLIYRVGQPPSSVSVFHNVSNDTTAPPTAASGLGS
jgi:hypothetical protein